MVRLKVPEEEPSDEDKDSFNSTMVRLKAKNAVPGAPPPGSFNSTMVRLKVIAVARHLH